jgi:hypothetical protein
MAPVGIGYRSATADWMRKNLARFDGLEIMADHSIFSDAEARAAFSSRPAAVH